MAFKLRSGNKTTFKNMGSSPVKATSTLSTSDAEAILQRNQEYKDKKIEERRQYQEDLMNYAPWNVKKPGTVEIDDKDVEMEEGWDYTDLSEDANINKYKSKDQIKHERRRRKIISRTDDPTTEEDESKYTQEERREDRIADLKNKKRRAKGTGGYGLKFDWRNMLLGDSVASGFSIEKKEELLDAKIKKTKSKYAKQDRKKKQKKEIKELKTTKKNTKKYKKYLSDLNNESSALGYEDFLETLDKK